MPDLSMARRAPPLIGSDVTRLLPPASRFILRGGREVMLAAGAALRLDIAEMACRSAQRDSLAALWLGPDEQLILDVAAHASEIERLLTEALTSLPHSLVNISHRQIAFELSGAQAETVLSVGCPLDLHASAFPVGMCTRTLLGKADIVLWRTAPATFHVEVWRSFADYMTRFLAEAARELAR